jgi:catechol 2,3-dioxygenase-like lactoylglutathione lyase family enzyme
MIGSTGHGIRRPEASRSIGRSLRPSDFGFRLTKPTDIEIAIAEVERAGGRILRRGEFGPGFPFVYVADPDGYEIEVWFE